MGVCCCMELLFSIGLSAFLAFCAIYKKALTYFATLLAFLSSVVITYCGGIPAFLVLTLTFIGTLIADKFFIKRKEKIFDSTNEKHGRRDAIQVFCNVGVATIAILLYGIFKDGKFFWVYASVMASSLADSMASEIGVLTNGKTFDLRTGKVVEKGMSGGVSVLGLGASFIGAFTIALITMSFDFSFRFLCIVTLCGWFGAFIDSLLGALFQVKYRCSVCRKLTEKHMHCNHETIYQGGISWLNNDAVNLCNNIITFLISLLILIFLY